MDLWVRSQDKTTLMKVDRLDIDYSSGLYSIKSYGFGTLLANYKSEESVLEVLDEIQELIKPKQIITTYESEIKECINKTTFDVVMTPKIDNIQLIEPTTLVYEMPAE